ncbi:MAG: hypothetical protein KF784_14200 [Fimbriimonadaceae bacterium]|nr:hypothetical protein [Fimbriimonadaceae bacterium]
MRTKLVQCLVGMIGFFVLVATCIALFGVNMNRKSPASSTVLLSNIKQCGTCLAIYSADNDDRLPDAYRWMTATWPYSQNAELYRDPKNKDSRMPTDPDVLESGLYGIAFFEPMSEVKPASLAKPETQIMLFTSKHLGWNAAAGLDTANPTARRDRITVALVDFSARHINLEDIAKYDSKTGAKR